MRIPRIDHLKTRNVVGVIPGTSIPTTCSSIPAHWDHFGRKDDAPGPDKIFNGAVDNGMGTSMVLELAEKFAHDKRPQRSVGFLFWTMEEQGLLGSEYFAEHPVWPRDHIVGLLNTDADGAARARRTTWRSAATASRTSRTIWPMR